MDAVAESGHSLDDSRVSFGWLWACRASVLAAAAVVWIFPGAFFHFSETRTAIRTIALVPATFPFAVALLWLCKNPPRRGALQLAVGAALTALIFILGSYLRASKHVWAPVTPAAIVSLPELLLIATAMKNHGVIIKDGDYGLRFFSRTALAIYFSAICFVVALFLSGTLR